MCPAVWCGAAKLDQRGPKEGEGRQDDGRRLTAVKQISNDGHQVLLLEEEC